MDRPKKLTPEMAMVAAMKTAEQLVRLCRMEQPVEELAAAIAKHGRLYGDGYELAKTLDDRCYWDCNLEIAEELDSFASFARSEIERAEEAWAAEYAATPPFPVEARVALKDARTGQITGLYKGGKYLVAVDGDEMAAEPTCRRSIINYEDLSPIPAPPDGVP